MNSDLLLLALGEDAGPIARVLLTAAALVGFAAQRRAEVRPAS